MMNFRSDLCNRSRSQTLIAIAAKKYHEVEAFCADERTRTKGREPYLNCFGPPVAKVFSF